jgi:hypothetical protein
MFLLIKKMEELNASAPYAPLADWIEVEAQCAAQPKRNMKHLYTAVAITGAVAAACIFPQMMMKGAFTVLIMPNISINTRRR